MKFKSRFIDKTLFHMPDQGVIRLGYTESYAARFGCGEAGMLGKMLFYDLNVGLRTANETPGQTHPPSIRIHRISHLSHIVLLSAPFCNYGNRQQCPA